MTAATQAKRPTQIQVGYVPYTVEYVSDEEEWAKRGGDPDDGGQTEGWKASILVRVPDGIHEAHVREVLLHELLHACVYVSGLSIEGARHWHGDIEEEFIHRTSPILLGVIQNNPKLAAYLVG